MPEIVQNLIRIEDILKNEYLPFLNNVINVEPSIFMEKIRKGTLTAAQGEFGARIGVGGGFGMSEEGHATPKANAPIYSKFKYTTRDGYCDIKISHKTVKLGQQNSAVLKNAVKDEIDASYETTKWNSARMLFGNGSGLLAKTAGAATDSKTITVDSTATLIEGLSVDIYASAAADAPISGAEAVQITDINHATKTITLSAEVSVSTGACIYNQNSKDREITGLGSIFDDAVTEIYGVEKANRASIVPYSVDAQNDIDDIKITRAIQIVERQRQCKIDLLMLGDDAYAAYLAYLHETNTKYVVNNDYKGGFSSVKVLLGNREVDVYNEQFVPSGNIWGVDTDQFELRQTGWDFAAYQSSIFNLAPGTSVYRALLANYMELICRNPGACINIKNVGAA